MGIIQKIKCKFGFHTYDFTKHPMEMRVIEIDKEPAYLFTFKCECCGRVRRDIHFIYDRNRDVEDIETIDYEEVKI